MLLVPGLQQLGQGDGALDGAVLVGALDRLEIAGGRCQGARSSRANLGAEEIVPCKGQGARSKEQGARSKEQGVNSYLDILQPLRRGLSKVPINAGLDTIINTTTG